MNLKLSGSAYGVCQPKFQTMSPSPLAISWGTLDQGTTEPYLSTTMIRSLDPCCANRNWITEVTLTPIH